MPLVEQLRTGLKHNKIFFEIGAAVLIGGASLIVSCSALRVSEKTLSATEVASLPHFSVSKRPRFDTASGKFKEETLVLNNHGAPVSNVSWTIRTFLAFDRYRPSRGVAYVPLVGYYVAQFPTSSPTGELASAVGHENLRKFGVLYADALAHKESDFDYLPYPSLLTIGVVAYEDRLGRSATTYFRNEARVDESNVRPFLDLSSEMRGLDIDTVKLTDAIALAKSPDALYVQDHSSSR